MALTANDFLQCVLKSGLLQQEGLDKALSTLPGPARDDPQALADHLVQTGRLSKFQAHKLLKGATVGLTLGPFRIQFPIARGGMGTVYLALDTRNQQHVAVKVLPPKKAREKSRHLARFQREMKISTRVVHPHLALTHEIGIHQGVHFIAMEYIPGQSLYRLVQTEGPLPVPRAARLFSEVAAGLQHAHSLNLVHRDLKPSNIMITPNDHAKVLDLGLALIEGEDTEPTNVVGGPGYLVGSFDYMAPEQTENSIAVDARADIYALGCTLYFALTGQPPFPGGGKKEKVQAHRNLRPTPLLERNPAVPEKFARLVEKMMAKNPAERIPTAKVLREELAPWSGQAADKPLDRSAEVVVNESVQSVVNQSAPGEESLDDFLFFKESSIDTSKWGNDPLVVAFWVTGSAFGILFFGVLVLILIRTLR